MTKLLDLNYQAPRIAATHTTDWNSNSDLPINSRFLLNRKYRDIYTDTYPAKHIWIDGYIYIYIQFRATLTF